MFRHLVIFPTMFQPLPNVRLLQLSMRVLINALPRFQGQIPSSACKFLFIALWSLVSHNPLTEEVLSGTETIPMARNDSYCMFCFVFWKSTTMPWNDSLGPPIHVGPHSRGSRVTLAATPAWRFSSLTQTTQTLVRDRCIIINTIIHPT